MQRYLIELSTPCHIIQELREAYESKTLKFREQIDDLYIIIETSEKLEAVAAKIETWMIRKCFSCEIDNSRNHKTRNNPSP